MGTTGIHLPEDITDAGLLTGHPWFSGIETHLLKTSAMLRASTIGEKRRKLQHIGRVLEVLQKTDPTLSTDPGKFTEREVSAFINWMRENQIDPATQRKYLQLVRDYCLFHDNSIVHKMKIIYKSSWPKAVRKPIKSLNIHEVNQIIESVQDWKGWWGDVARFVCVIYPHIGARPSELRTLLFADLNIDELSIRISEPKGVGIYAMRREVEVDRYYRELIEQFVEAREQYLASFHATSKYLIPYAFRAGPKSGQADCWSSGLWSKLSRRIQTRSGVAFSWKWYRAACVDIDRNIYDMGIEDISLKLGHSTVVTTEAFYGRLQMGKAKERRVACLIKAKQTGELAIIPTPDGKVKIQYGPKEI